MSLNLLACLLLVGCPTMSKLAIYGNIKVGARYIGRAKKQMRFLHVFMGFQNLKIGVTKKIIDKTVLIKTWKHGGMQGIEIHTLKPPPEERKIQNRHCFCNCCLSLGIVLRFTNQEHQYNDEDIRFDVAVCHYNDKSYVNGSYVEYQGCVPSDYSQYVTEDEFLAEGREIDSLELRAMVYVSESAFFSDCEQYCLEILDECTLGACIVISPKDHNSDTSDPIFKIIPINVDMVPIWL